MVVAGRREAWIILLAGVAACARTPAPPAGTGAREAARAYHEALVRQDWQQAYGALHPEDRPRLLLETFTRLAQAYCRSPGFDLEEAPVQSCTEQGTEAMAHVVLKDHRGPRAGRYRDAVNLRQNAEGRQVVLPGVFANARR